MRGEQTEFGLYDDDPQIETLGGSSFFDKVFQSNDVWFVNFYSPGCGHCHELAPVWRQFGYAMEGIIGVGAVNCHEQWHVCQRMGINAYPTLLVFTTPGAYTAYRGHRTVEHLAAAVLAQVPAVAALPPARFVGAVAAAPLPRTRHWLVLVCVRAHAPCPSADDVKLLALAVKGTMDVGLLDCAEDPAVCADHGYASPQAVFFAVAVRRRRRCLLVSFFWRGARP